MEPAKQQNAVIYVRVSTKEQVENMSLDTQEKHCRALCERDGLSVVRVFREEGESAKTANRTEFQRMLAFATSPRNAVRAVVFYAVDRFMRNAEAFHASRGLLRRHRVGVRYVLQATADDAQGRFLEGIAALVAEYENTIKADRTRDGMREAAQRGRWVSKPPIGYLRGARGRDAGPSLVPDPDRAHFVLQAFESFASGRFQKAEVLAKLTAQGFRDVKGRPVAKQTFDHMLRSRAYIGRVVIMKWKFEEPGDFAPIVPVELFEAVQGLLSGRRVGPASRMSEHPDFPLRVFSKCACCGVSITGSHSTGRAGARYAYYRCPNSKCGQRINVRKEKMETAFVDLLRSLQPKPSYLRLFRAVVLDAWQARRGSAAAERAQLSARIEALHERKQKFTAAVVDGTIRRQEYVEAIGRLDAEIAEARAAEQAAAVEEVNVETVLAFAERAFVDLAGLWERLAPPAKRRLQSAMFPQGVAFDGSLFGTTATSPIFTYLRAIAGSGDAMATPTGLEAETPGRKVPRLRRFRVGSKMRGRVRTPSQPRLANPWPLTRHPRPIQSRAPSPMLSRARRQPDSGTRCPPSHASYRRAARREAPS